MINPEWEPGDDDDHEGGEVDGDDVVADLPVEQEVYLQTTVLPWYQASPLQIQDCIKIKGGFSIWADPWLYFAILLGLPIWL